MSNPFQMCQHGYNPYAAHPDTGGFFSSISHAVSSVAKAAVKPVSKIASTVVKVTAAPASLTTKLASAVGIPHAGLLNYIVAPQTLATKQGGLIAAQMLNTVAHPNVKNLIASAQVALKNAGPLGLVGSGAIGAMQAGLSGKSLEQVAWAAAEGAAPAGIDKAIMAAQALRNGSNVLNTVVSTAASSFTPGSPEAFGYATAISTLKAAATKAALGVARNALPSEGARRAFDVGVGIVSKAASGNGMLPRPGIPNISLAAPRSVLSAIPSATKAVSDALKVNPALAAKSLSELASTFRTSPASVLDAIKLSKNPLPWRSLSAPTVSFIQRFVPHAPIMALRLPHTNIGGLSSTGTTYIVEKGDGPWAIAQKLVGNGNRWTEMKDYNKDKNPTIDKNIWVGEVLNLPPSWQKPTVVVAPPVVALPGLPPPILSLPTPAPAVNDLSASILQAKSILAAWGKTDGINQSGLSDYGLNPLDLTATMGPRDTLMLTSFQNWDNKTLQTGLNTNGNLDAATLQALQAWATAKATAVLPPTAILPNGGNALPTVTPPAVITIPEVIGGTDSTVKPSPLPTVTPKPASATPAKGSNAPFLIGGGAVAGGLLFGPVGALMGAAVGAAIS